MIDNNELQGYNKMTRLNARQSHEGYKASQMLNL